MPQYTLNELIHPVGDQFIVAAWEDGRYYARPSLRSGGYKWVFGKNIAAIAGVAQRFDTYERARDYASLNYSIIRDESS